MEQEQNLRKEIKIIGQSNRYQIKKLTEKKEPRMRKQVPIVSSSICEKDILNEFLSLRNDHVILSSDMTSLIKEIERKKSGYQRQDVIKNRYLPEQFIQTMEIVEKLIACDLKCYYCNQDVCIIYDMVREKNQWSLDRIDNNIGHNNDNVVVSCLECNLKRRRTQQKAFVFTKQLSIVRENYQES